MFKVTQSTAIILFTVLFLIVGLAIGWQAASRYFAFDSNNPLQSTKAIVTKQLTNITPNPEVEPSSLEEITTANYTAEVVAQDLFVPWSIVFTSPNRMLISERSGDIRVLEDGVLQTEPLISFSEVDARGEEGLMGLTLDPNYTENAYLYACVAYPKDGGYADKVIRLIDNGQTAQLDQTIIDAIPAAQFHAGCELGFGPDGKLYISTGDATDRQIAQDLSSLGGKILRLNADGSIPDDNPFAGSAIWSYGHRNPQGIGWHPVTNQLFSVEHGPTVFDGPAGGDEINLITKGGNYGWPVVSHENTAEGMISPLLVFTPAVAPGSLTFYTGNQTPQLSNNLLVGLLKGEGILRVVLEPFDYNQVVVYQKLPGIEFGRIREVTMGPDGHLYFTTSNRDGRGQMRPNDDKIYKLIPN